MCIFTGHGIVYYHFAYWLDAWKTSGQPRIKGLNYRVENVIKHWFMSQLRIHRDMKHLRSLESTQEALTHLSCSPNFPRASNLDERTLTHEPMLIVTDIHTDTDRVRIKIQTDL